MQHGTYLQSSRHVRTLISTLSGPQEGITTHQHGRSRRTWSLGSVTAGQSSDRAEVHSPRRVELRLRSTTFATQSGTRRVNRSRCRDLQETRPQNCSWVQRLAVKCYSQPRDLKQSREEHLAQDNEALEGAITGKGEQPTGAFQRGRTMAQAAQADMLAPSNSAALCSSHCTSLHAPSVVLKVAKIGHFGSSHFHSNSLCFLTQG